MGGGLNIFAEAVTGKKGVDATKTFMEGMKKGLYDSAKWLPIVAERMQKMAYESGVVDKSTQNLESSVNRLNNAWFELMVNSEENGLGGTMARVIDYTTEKLRGLDKWLQTNKKTVDGIGTAFDIAFQMAKTFFDYIVSDTGVLLLMIVLASKAGGAIKAMLPYSRLLPYFILAGLFTEIKSTIDGADTIFSRMGITAKQMADHFDKYGKFYGAVGGAAAGAYAGRKAGPWGAGVGAVIGAFTGGNIMEDDAAHRRAVIRETFKAKGAAIWNNAKTVQSALTAFDPAELYGMGMTPSQMREATGGIPRAATGDGITINGDVNVVTQDPEAFGRNLESSVNKMIPKGKQ